ncbi:hypothetical protein ACFRFU_36830 [Streptomyces sp. NPDC056704]|uniref:hypothetical protein n=1 Tax=Streptomyces sp. NPDC056704 TaxID=3345917 RepID=UPI0036939D1E
MTVTIKVVTRQKPGEGCAANAELVPVQERWRDHWTDGNSSTDLPVDRYLPLS